jgi:hypothetical protein
MHAYIHTVYRMEDGVAQLASTHSRLGESYGMYETEGPKSRVQEIYPHPGATTSFTLGYSFSHLPSCRV